MSARRLLGLYLRSRRSLPALLIVLGLAAATWLLLAWVADRTATKVLLIILPLAPAAIIGAALGSPFGEAERAAGQPLPLLRLAQLALLLLVAGSAFAVANLPAMGDDFRWLLLRNGAGYAGLALLGVRLLGAQRAWLVPLFYGLFVTLAPGHALSRESRWLWPIHPPAYGAAVLIAVALLTAGLLVGVLGGSRATADETVQ